MLRIMVDTSVLFSGLFFKGKPYKVLDIINRNHKLILSEDIIKEIYGVVDKRFPGRRYVFDAFLSMSKYNIIHRARFRRYLKEASVLIRDKKDAPILACALAIKPDYFVTSDPDFHTDKIKQRVKIVDVNEFLKLGFKDVWHRKQ